MFLFRWIIIWEVYDKFDFTSLEKGNPEIFVSFNNGVLHCFNLPICELGFFCWYSECSREKPSSEGRPKINGRNKVTASQISYSSVK